MARMERELDGLCERNTKDVAALQSEHRDEESAVLQNLDAKKGELRHRWDLEEAILRRQLEVRHGQLYGPLPPVSFSETAAETHDSAI